MSTPFDTITTTTGSLPSAARRWAGIAALAVVGCVVLGAILPRGLPFGVIVLGLVLGGLSSFTAMGLVLIYRSARVINFAQAEIGGLASTVAIVMVAGWHLPYFVALPVGLAVAIVNGAIIDATIVRKFFTAPRMILTVATVGLAQLLGSAELAIPGIFTHLRPLSTFSTPFHFRFRLGPLIFNGDDVVAMVIVPVVLVGLMWFFGRNDTGIAIRGAADSNERAVLLGIPIRRLSRTTWMLAAGLSGLGAMLSAPIVGPTIGAVVGPQALLVPLAAAVIAQMESLPVAVAASLGLGIFEQAVFWSYPQSSTVDVAIFGVIALALLLRRQRKARASDSGLGGYVALREPRPVPRLLAQLPIVRLSKTLAWVVVAVVTIAIPNLLNGSRLTLLAYMAIYGIIALSLVVLSGWSGQISLGQFAFVGVGAATTAALLVHAHLDFFVALVGAATVGAVVSVLVGVPSLRMKGLFLAVSTLAFGVPVSTFLLNSTYFPLITPAILQRPVIFGRIDLASPKSFYFFCLAILGATLWVVRNLRASRVGRTIVATRDNERAAAAYGIEPVRAKLTAFAVAGALAGLAGGLYVVALEGVPFSGFSPESSLQVLTMVVIGGLGSIPGAILGAVYVESAQDFLHGSLQLLATGAGLLGLLTLVPGGLSQVFYDLRDRALRVVAARHGVSAPGFTHRADPQGFGTAIETSDSAEEPVGPTREVPIGEPAVEPLVRLRDVSASYGSVQVLFDVDLDVQPGEILTLLGTNGAGKSTVLRVLAGLLPAGAGSVVVGGRDMAGLDPVDRVKQGLVTVPGGRGVFGSLTVEENLRLATWTTRSDKQFVTETMHRIFELFPSLRTRLNSRAELLSGGEQQMLTLSQALLCRPSVLLIDELSLGLAPSVVDQLLDFVVELNRTGTTVVVVEQSVQLALGLSERAIFMERGQIRFSGPTRELMEREDLVRAVFLRVDRQVERVRRDLVVPAYGAEFLDGSDQPGIPAALAISNLSKSYGAITAVRDVNLSVKSGEIFGIIGSNGAGKTSLFDLCSGFARADSGKIVLDGVDLTHARPAVRAELGLGRSFQDAQLFSTMTVEEVVAAAAERHLAVRDPFAFAFSLSAARRSEEEVVERSHELLKELGAAQYANAFISELSTGTRRIVELACTLALEPSVLLLDEPSTGISQAERGALASLLLQVREATGATLVVIEHDVPLVSGIADRIACMHLGQVIAIGAPSDVLASPEVVSSYLGHRAVDAAQVH